MYTDPGSGVFFLQIIAAALLTAGYRFRRWIVRLFVPKHRNDVDADGN